MTATVVVSGAIANKHLSGGEAWVRLSWILGLSRLGCDVYFIEQIDRATCVDEDGEPTDFERSANLAYFRDVVERFGIADSSALVYGGGERTSGMPYDELVELGCSADLLVNISGHLDVEPLKSSFRRKAFVDLDPGYTQLWHAAGNPDARIAGHDSYFTVAESINEPHVTIPLSGIAWHAVRPPVVLEEWPQRDAAEHDRFTTVASWRGAFGQIEHEGETHGLKVHEFRKFIMLPRHARGTFEIALDIHPGDAKDLKALIANGWRILSPREVASGTDEFRRYVQESGAEFSVAQGIYVATRMGWFSDRTVRYLASGKPALVQDTGFSDHYPIGEGLLPFTTMEDAIAGATAICSDYDAHAQAARAVAERYFDSDLVLPRFLEQAGIQ